LCWGVALITAPFFGGYLQYYFDWHAAFYALTAIAVILLLLVCFLLPETLHKDKTKNLSVKNLLKRCTTIASHPVFLACASMNTIFYLFILTFSLLGPFLIQNQWKYTAVMYGHLALLIGAAWVLGGYLSKWLATRLSKSQIMINGMLILTVIILINLRIAMTTHNTVFTLMIPLIASIITCGCLFPVSMASGMSVFDKSLGGTASSMLGVITFLLSAIISFFISRIHPSSQEPWAIIMLVLLIINWVFAVVYITAKSSKNHTQQL
jgi:predicted MFS family arabinose efflux permease